MMSAQMLAAASTTPEITMAQGSMKALDASAKEEPVCFLVQFLIEILTFTQFYQFFRWHQNQSLELAAI